MKKKSLIFQLKFVISIIWKSSPEKIVWQSIIGFLQAVESFIFSILFIKFVIQLLEENGELYQVVILSAITIALKFLVVYLNSYYSIKLKPIFDLHVTKYIQTTLFSKAMSLDLAQYESKDFHEKYYKAVSNAESTMDNVISNCIQFVNHFIAVIAIALYVIKIDPFLVLMMLIPILTTLSTKWSNTVRYELNMKNSEPKRKMDYINRVMYLKEYALELKMSEIYLCLKDMYQDASESIRINYKKYGKRLSCLRLVSDFLLTTFTILFSYLYAGWRYLYANSILLSDFAVLINAINNMNGKVNSLLNNIYALHDSSLYVNNIQEFLSENPVITTNENGIDVSSEKKLKFSFNSVYFKYSEDAEYSLSNINLEIYEGEKIAVVGKNGSGKSTLIKLLMRLYDTTSGSISINGTHIKNVHLGSYRSLFTPVFQDFKLFATSIENNITLGEQKTNEADYALQCAGFQEVKSLKNGIESLVTREFDNDGAVFSGGQSQKLAISRGFASKSKIVILDEPSASLDPEAEHKIYENVYKYMNDKTVIFVSHRLTSTIMADKIIMMDAGQIRESGTHKELMGLRGEYYKLFRLQAEAYGG